jgi:hypothetical protein
MDIPTLYDSDNPRIGRIGMQGDSINVAVCTNNPTIEEDIKLFANALGKDDELLNERMKILSDLLKEMGY